MLTLLGTRVITRPAVRRALDVDGWKARYKGIDVDDFESDVVSLFLDSLSPPAIGESAWPAIFPVPSTVRRVARSTRDAPSHSRAAAWLCRPWRYATAATWRAPGEELHTSVVFLQALVPCLANLTGLHCIACAW
jgi:hypothetical protein